MGRSSAPMEPGFIILLLKYIKKSLKDEQLKHDHKTFMEAIRTKTRKSLMIPQNDKLVFNSISI